MEDRVTDHLLGVFANLPLNPVTPSDLEDVTTFVNNKRNRLYHWRSASTDDSRT